jgi:hypothetical protein
MHFLTISLIVTIITLLLGLLFFGIGEFSDNLVTSNQPNIYYGYFKTCINNVCSVNHLNISQLLTTIGFILGLHSTVFSIVLFLLERNLSRENVFKILLVILSYNILAIIFMISGWNELKDWIYSSSNFNSIAPSWSYNFLITGFSFSVFSVIPIGFSIFKTFK